jgi:hypothetical protein
VHGIDAPPELKALQHLGELLAVEWRESMGRHGRAPMRDGRRAPALVVRDASASARDPNAV